MQSPNQNLELKSPDVAPTTIGAGEAEKVVSMPRAVRSKNSQKRVEKHTKRVHADRDKLTKRDALEIIESALQLAVEAGIGTAVVTLPKKVLASAGIVLSEVVLCDRCNKMLPVGDEEHECRVK